jgi:hypothetical protein
VLLGVGAVETGAVEVTIVSAVEVAMRIDVAVVVEVVVVVVVVVFADVGGIILLALSISDTSCIKGWTCSRAALGHE